MEFLIATEAVAPINIPSQVKAAQLTTGITSSHGRNGLDASITSILSVSIFTSGSPATRYARVDTTPIERLHIKITLTDFTSETLSRAPIYLPDSASPAYAKPSIK